MHYIPFHSQQNGQQSVGGLKGTRRLQEAEPEDAPVDESAPESEIEAEPVAAEDAQAESEEAAQADEGVDESETENESEMEEEGTDAEAVEEEVEEEEESTDVAIAGGFTTGFANAGVTSLGGNLAGSAFGRGENYGYSSSFANGRNGEMTGADSFGRSPAIAAVSTLVMDQGFSSTYANVDTSGYGLSLSFTGQLLAPVDLIGGDGVIDSPSDLPFLGGGGAFGAFGGFGSISPPPESTAPSEEAAPTDSASETEPAPSDTDTSNAQEEPAPAASAEATTVEEVAKAGTTEEENSKNTKGKPAKGGYGGFGAIDP